MVDFTGDVLTLRFLSQKDLDNFKSTTGAADALRAAIFEVLGAQVKFKPQIADAAEQQIATEPAAAAKPENTRNKMVDESARYGESVLREVLGAEPIDSKTGK